MVYETCLRNYEKMGGIPRQKLARTCFDILRKYFACYLVSVKSFENRNFSADAITLTLVYTHPSNLV
jgi:hypothetical protein